MSWDFIVPVCSDDLVKSGAVNQYVVQEVLSIKQLNSHINSFKAALRSQGPLCILEHFDTAYSVLHYISHNVSQCSLFSVVRGLSVSLPTLLLSGSLSAMDREQQLNAVKMSVFLLCKLTETLESDSYRETIVTAPNKDKVAGKGLLQWDSERETVLQCLTQLLQLDIRTLWSLSLVEEEFVSCVTCCCYKLLENPTINHMKSKSTRDAIIHVLGIMVKKYNHMLGACVKVIQLLQHFEQLASVCAQAVASWSSEYGVKVIVREIMREIGQKSSEELAREGSGVKAFSSFLSELGTLVPETMIPNISVLLTHLEGESPSLRVAVCEVLGEVLVRVLSGDKLDDSARASRDRFLDTLQEHIHDAHSHVRARVLQVYARVVNSKALPLCRYTEVMELTVGRLGDKSVHVCKSAIQLLAAFIAHNPYSCKLSSVDLTNPLEKEMAKLKEMRDSQKEHLCLCISLLSGPEQETPEAVSSDALPTPQKEGGGNEGRETELKKQEMLVQYLKDTESFALQVERFPLIILPLSVVQEAVQFCVTAFEFSVADSVCGVRKMLPLVWSTDVTIKDAVIQAYRRLYLNPHGDNTRGKAQTLVDNLSDLTIDASLGTVQCLEEIVSVFCPALVQVLWERFSGKRETKALHRRAAVLLLGMAARAEREVVLSNLDTLCSVALGEKVAEDYLLARDTLITIANITDHVRVCIHILCINFQSDPHWQTFMEQAVRLIYFLAESPDQLCSRLLQRSAHLLLEQITEGGEPKQSQLQEGGSQGSEDLAQVLSLCGAVAFWQVSHLERSVSAELRRRRGEKEEEEEKEKAPANKKVNEEFEDSPLIGCYLFSEANDSCVEGELGLVGASAEDTEAEIIRKICETELLSEGNMLSAFLPLLVKVCSSPGKYSHPQLTTAACLALSQYMMISPAVCKDNIRLLFTVLEKSPLLVVRANTIVALGDLTVRFPNILEPWTPNLYARLSDESASVRLTAITVLTQLVLKDVMKVKGQVSEVAVLLLDPEPHIASLALNFFNELSAKDNAIYNLLPDIISRLSDPERGMKEEDFNTIMKQLFSYITKERQTESLVEKLCQRFRTAKTERQWADLAISLSLLSLCERGFKKLQECWDCYSDKLAEPGVYQPLLSIAAKLRRRAKPQFKAQVEDYEKRLTAVHTKGLENVESEEREQQIGDTQSQNLKTPQKSVRKTTRGEEIEQIRPQKEFYYINSSCVSLYPSGRSKPKLDDSDLVTPRKSRSRPKPTITFTSDEEEEEGQSLSHDYQF
uniref:Condensin complex subunit 1 n=1 Tax=Sinocyclocheilus anshuiensis TaxID=1608454 RepID=A0A671LUT6_9TELE